MMGETWSSDDVEEMKSKEIPERIEADDIVEFLAEMLHEKWVSWAENLLETEHNLSEERMERWHEFLCDWEYLPEQAKEIDRQHAQSIFILMVNNFPRMVDFLVLDEEKLNAVQEREAEEIPVCEEAESGEGVREAHPEGQEAPDEGAEE